MKTILEPNADDNDEELNLNSVPVENKQAFTSESNIKSEPPTNKVILNFFFIHLKRKFSNRDVILYL